MTTPVRVGLLCSVGQTLDAFFPRLVDRWEREHGWAVFCAAGTASSAFADAEVIAGLSRRPGPQSLHTLSQLREWARRNRLDAVLTNTATASAAVRLAGLEAPIIYFCHGLHWNRRGPASFIPRVIEAALLTRTAGVICINSDDERWFSRRRARNLIRLNGGVGVDLRRFPVLPLAGSEGPLRVVWVGELSQRKNPEAIVRIARILTSRGIELTVDVLGEGALEPQIRRAVDRLGVAHEVRLRGRVDPTPYYARADLVAHTAHWEGLPRVLIEASVSGRRVVAFDVKGVRDIPGAVLVAEGDDSGFADAVEEIGRNRRVQPTGTELARSGFSDERAADLIAAHLRAAIASCVGTPTHRDAGRTRP